MVIITRGTFGYFDGKRVKPITNADGPQSFDAKLEERLVRQGVAEYVEGKADKAEEPAGEWDGFTRAQLVSIAADKGIEKPNRLSRAKLVEALEALEGDV